MAISSIGTTGLSARAVGNHAASRTEMAQKMLTGMDADQSGSVSKAEFVAFGEKMKAQVPLTQGANAPRPASGTNALPPPSADKLFASADQNADQSLSVDELSSMLAEVETHAKASQSGMKGRGPGGPGGMGGPPGGAPPAGHGAPAGGARSAGGGKAPSSSSETENSTASSSTKAADTNKDGVVSAAEELLYELTHPTSSSSSDSSSSTQT